MLKVKVDHTCVHVLPTVDQSQYDGFEPMHIGERSLLTDYIHWVDHMHMKVLDKFTKDAMEDFNQHLTKSNLKQAVKEDIASFRVWPDWYNLRQT